MYINYFIRLIKKCYFVEHILLKYTVCSSDKDFRRPEKTHFANGSKSNLFFFETQTLNGVCLVTQSCLTLQPHGLYPTSLLCPWDVWGKTTGVSCHFLLHTKHTYFTNIWLKTPECIYPLAPADLPCPSFRGWGSVGPWGFHYAVFGVSLGRPPKRLGEPPAGCSLQMGLKIRLSR